MPRHIRGRVTQRRPETVRPIRVSPWRATAASERLPDTKVSRCAPLLSGRPARNETKLIGIYLNGL